MADISKIKLPNSTVLDLKDATARSQLSSKAPLDSPTLTGTPTAPTAADGTNTTQIATTAFVQSAFKANDAMVFKGTIGSSGATVTALPATHSKGWTYKVVTAGSYAGKTCEIGDMIICVTDGTAANNDHWTIIQANIDGAVTGPTSSTDATIAVFNGTSGKVIKDSGFTIGKSVPSTAVFTDTNTKVTSAANHYTPATASGSDVTASATGATAAWSIDVVKGITLNTDGKGHVTGMSVTSGKIPANPNTDTHRVIKVNDTQALASNTTALNLKAGSNVTITDGGSGAITIAATNTTYSSKTAASGGTDVSLVTTGEKYTWNQKTSNTGTVTKVSTGAGLTGGDITTTGTVKADLLSETKLTNAAAAATETAGKIYPVALDKNGKLAVNVPWTNSDTKNTAGSTDTSSKIFLIGATSQAANPTTYSHDTAYVGTDGCLYSGGVKVLTSHQDITGKVDKTATAGVAYGTCSTAAATAEKAITISGKTGWALEAGAQIVVKFSYTNKAQNPTFNVNSTGAKSVWYNTALITTGSLEYAGTANRPMAFVYDGTQYIFMGWAYDANTTYANYSFGQGYGTCSTAEATEAKAVTLSNYALSAGGIVSVKFTYAVPANATMDINSKGAKNIFFRGAKITAGVISAGDVATFMYDGTQYHLISVDNWGVPLTTTEINAILV